MLLSFVNIILDIINWLLQRWFQVSFLIFEKLCNIFKIPFVNSDMQTFYISSAIGIYTELCKELKIF